MPTVEWHACVAYARVQAATTQRRHLAHAYRIGTAWHYAVVPAVRASQWAQPPRRESPRTALRWDEVTPESFALMMDAFPRCAQRANAHHGGGFKRAIPTRALANTFAKYLTRTAGQPTHAYRCDLPAPAIGPHCHLATGKY